MVKREVENKSKLKISKWVYKSGTFGDKSPIKND